MRAQFLAFGIGVALLGASPAAAGAAGDYLLKPVEGGGYLIERSAAPAAAKTTRGLATVADLVSLLDGDAAAPENIDFTAGKKMEGVYTVLVGRSDGSLGKYERARDVIIFAAPSSLTTRGDLTTLTGAVVFALKVDNSGAPGAVQRFETGVISLTRARGSL
jgi:hypothetical protein